MIFHAKTKKSLHARTVSELCNGLHAYSADVILEYKHKLVDLKSVLGVISLGLYQNTEVICHIDGSDEDQVKGFLREYFVF